MEKIIIVCGHYGVGKTNFAINLACKLKSEAGVAVMDFDVVNPYFRSSAYKNILEEKGIRLIASDYAGSTLDIPAVSGRFKAEIENPSGYLVIDAGGDDAGSTLLGCYQKIIAAGGYDMLYVVNRYRPLISEPAAAVSVLHEIEAASGLGATGIVNNSHLHNETTAEDISASKIYAEQIAKQVNLPIVYTTVPKHMRDDQLTQLPGRFDVDIYVRPPWTGSIY